MEHRLRFPIGHVHFMLFVLISFALGTQREPSLQWNMGLKGKKLKRAGVEGMRFSEFGQSEVPEVESIWPEVERKQLPFTIHLVLS